MLIVIMMIGCHFEDPKAQLASENS
jgi:hypothetical protein